MAASHTFRVEVTVELLDRDLAAFEARPSAIGSGLDDQPVDEPVGDTALLLEARYGVQRRAQYDAP
jgi:hypothetical protein